LSKFTIFHRRQKIYKYELLYSYLKINGQGRSASFIAGSAGNGIKRICLAGEFKNRLDLSRIANRQRARQTDFQ
jgi:hypothetical protein